MRVRGTRMYTAVCDEIVPDKPSTPIGYCMENSLPKACRVKEHLVT